MLTSHPTMKLHVSVQLVQIVLHWFPEPCPCGGIAENKFEVRLKEGDILHRSDVPRLRCQFVALIMTLKNRKLLLRNEGLVQFIAVRWYVSKVKVRLWSKGVEDRQVELKHTVPTLRACHGIEQVASRLLIDSHC